LDDKVFTSLINLVFVRAVLEGRFAGMYARMCATLHWETKEVHTIPVTSPDGTGGTKPMFKTILADKCRAEFYSLMIEVAEGETEEEKERAEEGV